jgi:tRNA threonylcarbamoyl adenosine modification protein YeaZ
VLLLIDTAGPWCRVALGEEGVVVARRVRDMPRGQDAALFDDLAALLDGCDVTTISAVAVNAGPGGFTGLRVGIAAAAGIAAGYGVTLVGVPMEPVDGEDTDAALARLLVGARARLAAGQLGARPVYPLPPRADKPRHAPPRMLRDGGA